MKNNYTIPAFISLFIACTLSVSAHVVVKPAQVGIGAFQSFSIGVPVEKNIPTVGLKLIVPEGLQYVTPNVKPGWKVVVKKSGTSSDARVTEIDWLYGSIPAGMRDEFLFSAKVPSSEGVVVWKAYQTYSDGTVVAWDADPQVIEHDMAMGTSTEKLEPYSVTTIVDDLAGSKNGHGFNPIVCLSICALVLSLIAIVISVRFKKTV